MPPFLQLHPLTISRVQFGSIHKCEAAGRHYTTIDDR